MTKENKNKRISRREFLHLAGLVGISPFLPKINFDSSIAKGKELGETLQNWELVDIRYERGSLCVSQAPMLIIPLREDFFYDEGIQIETVNLKDNIVLSYENIFTIRSGDTGYRAVLVPMTAGEKGINIVFFEELNFRNNLSSPQKIKKLATLVDKESILSAFTYSQEVYPNKIFNILTAVGNILDYQQQNGPFVTGKEYSLIEAEQVGKDPEFITGRTTTGIEVKGGGICASATTFANSLWALGAAFKERWEHPTGYQYFIPPNYQGHKRTNTDTTLDLDSDGTNYDFRWEMPNGGPYYFGVTGAIIPNGKKNVGPLDFDADARLLLTFYWVKEDTTNLSLQRIKEMIDGYASYRESTRLNDQMGQSQVEKSETWEDSNSKRILELIYPEEKVINFKDELVNDEWLKTISEVRVLINDYSQKYDYNKYKEGIAPGVGTYLKSTSWYKSITPSEKFESALRHLDAKTYLVEGEAIQCIGFVILLSALGFNQSPKSVGGQGVSLAKDIIPGEITKRQNTIISRDGLLFKAVESLEEVEPGDLFVTYNSQTGHIGAVVGKKMVDGETVLLLADGNRKRDGRVKIFEVDKSNFDAVFGEYPYRKVLIKK